MWRETFILHVYTYLFGFLGLMSTDGGGAGISMGNMSTHISTLPYKKHKIQPVLFIPWWLYDIMIARHDDCMTWWLYDMMIVWHDDCMTWLYDMIVWHDDCMTWLYDMMIVWHDCMTWVYDMMIVWHDDWFWKPYVKYLSVRYNKNKLFLHKNDLSITEFSLY